MSGSQQRFPLNGLRRVLYVALALVFLGIGLVGVVLPGLPTTPFLLLMSYFLIRSWPWLHDQVVRVPVIGNAIRDWHENRGVRPHVKWTAYVMVLIAVVCSMLSPSLDVPLKVAVLLFSCCGIAVVWSLPTVQQPKQESPAEHLTLACDTSAAASKRRWLLSREWRDGSQQELKACRFETNEEDACDDSETNGRELTRQF